MTASEDYIPVEEEEFEEEKEDAAGKINILGFAVPIGALGILGGVFGVGVGVWLYLSVLQPTIEARNELQANIKEARKSIKQKRQLLQDMQELEAQKQKALQQQRVVASLFTRRETLSTLLFDINNLIARQNALIESQAEQLQLLNFTPESGLQEIPPEDTSLGSWAPGKLKKKVYSVTMEGTFEQLQSFVRNLERLESLLLIKNAEVELQQGTLEVGLGWRNGEVAIVDRSTPRLRTSFTLEAIVPRSKEEIIQQALEKQSQEGEQKKDQNQ
jgi:type IV pilus assembly protein PilO